MTERFKKQFDYNEKVVKAAGLAEALGYEEGYYGNLGCEDYKYCQKLRAEIKGLVGNEWPELVMKRYSDAFHEGYMDS